MRQQEEIKQLDNLNLLLKTLNQTDVGVSLSDYLQPDMPLIYVNEAFTKMTGYTSEEVSGKNCRFLQGDRPNDEAREIIRNAIKKGENCKVLLENYRKNGDYFVNELHLSPIFNENGELTHYAGIQHDVTEREETKESLRIRKELLSESKAP